MRRFDVWAPRAERVDLVLCGDGGDSSRGAVAREAASADAPAQRERFSVSPRRHAMKPVRDGWYTCDIDPEADPGREPGAPLDYGFSLDGDDPLPDPRSRWQPWGVHGPSRTVDHADFEWKDASWTGLHLPSAVVYELHVGTFTPAGTLEAAIERLDHLTDLGVTAVELMPVAAFPGRHGWGYDGVALWAVQHAYGGPDGLKQFVDACHRRGLGVILDVVYNHLGPSGNYLERFGPYFTDRYGTPWGSAVNFDGRGSDEVRRFVVDNAIAWLRDYHLDGLRLDAVHAIYDTSAVHVLEEMSEAVAAEEGSLGRPLWLIPESDLNDPRLLWSRERGGYGMDAQWSDDFHHALHAALTGEDEGYYGDFGSLADLAKALRNAFVYDGNRSAYRGRRHGRRPTGLSGHRFFGYLQNHDQVGNRARGERIGHLVDPDLAGVGAAVVLTAPFVPMLFQGEEWASSSPFLYFTDHQDPDLGRAVREGRRREFAAFGWDPEAIPDPQDPETFRRSRLDWDEREREPHATTLSWVRALVRLRRERPELSDGRLSEVAVRWDEATGWLAMRRGRLLTVANLSDEEVRPRVPALAPAGRSLRILLASESGTHVDGGQVVLAPRSAAIVEIVE